MSAAFGGDDKPPRAATENFIRKNPLRTACARIIPGSFPCFYFRRWKEKFPNGAATVEVIIVILVHFARKRWANICKKSAHIRVQNNEQKRSCVTASTSWRTPLGHLHRRKSRQSTGNLHRVRFAYLFSKHRTVGTVNRGFTRTQWAPGGGVEGVDLWRAWVALIKQWRVY